MKKLLLTVYLAALAAPVPARAGEMEDVVANAELSLARTPFPLQDTKAEIHVALIKIYSERLAELQRRRTELEVKAADLQAIVDANTGMNGYRSPKTLAQAQQVKEYRRIADEIGQQAAALQSKIERLEPAPPQKKEKR